MKIALLLTGQLRTFNMVKYLHMNSLISKYDCDVFMSINKQNNFQTENKNSQKKTSDDNISNAINFFNPINYFILEDFIKEMNNLKNINLKKMHSRISLNNRIKFLKNKKLKNIFTKKMIEKNNSFFANNFINSIMTQYFIVYNAYKLLEEHIQKTNKSYDLIIRLRFDQLIWTENTKIIMDSLYNHELKKIVYNEQNTEILKNISKSQIITFNDVLDNELLVFGFGDFHHYKYVNDQFWFHNMSLIHKMKSFYENIIDLIKYCKKNNIGNKGAIYECIFHQYLIDNNINFKKSNIKGIFIREF